MLLCLFLFLARPSHVGQGAEGVLLRGRAPTGVCGQPGVSAGSRGLPSLLRHRFRALVPFGGVFAPWLRLQISVV